MEGIFGKLAEARIREAIERGELKNLPGQGKPLNLEEMLFVPPELRAVYRIIKNAGLVPEEVSLNQEIQKLQQQLAACKDEAEAEEIKKKIKETSIHLSIMLEKRRPTRKR